MNIINIVNLTNRQLVIILVILLAMVNINILINVDADGSNYIDDHVQASIWNYVNTKQQPSKAVVLTISQEQWKATAAAALTPAFFDRTTTTPLFFDDGSEQKTISIPHDTKPISDYGTDLSSATSGIATTFWLKAEVVVVADSYEHVLWSVPIASFLSAPILVSPTATTFETLGTKCAIVVGSGAVEVDEVIELTTKQEVWQFQLELYETKGRYCNYVIITNPNDTDDTLDPNVKWPYLSLASAPLSAYRNALVLTGGYTVDKTKIDAIEKAVEKDDALYGEIKPTFDQIKADSYDMIKFLMDNGHDPEFLAVVGGPYEVPNYFYDIHVDYKFPTNKPQCTHYPSSIGAYAVLTENIDNTKYTKEDLASGRIIASSILDATNMLMKTFFYQEYLPGGDYRNIAPSNWEKTASIVDGHRLNQPENYPYNLIWDPADPYHPSNWVENEFNNASLDTTYYLVRNESDPYDTNKTISEIMEIATGSAYVEFLPHGGSTYLRIEIGIDPITGEAKSSNYYSIDVRDLNFKAPTITYTACCKGTTPYMLDEGFEITDFMMPAFIHAGCVAYIATPEIQSTCFWTEAPYGVSTEQNYLTWRNLFSDNVPIGKALLEAKWTARNNWQNKVAGDDPTHEVDCISYNLFGDPALEPYKPKIPYESTKRFDITVQYTEPKTSSEFTPTISIIDLDTGQAITDATITTEFNEKSESGADPKLHAQGSDGSYEMKITVTKDGYEQLQAKYWVYVTKADSDDDNGVIPGFEAGYIILVGSFIILAVYKKQLGTKRR